MPTEEFTRNPVPFGYCQCGCGELAPVATRNSSRNGWVKGQPKRFIQRHDHLVSGKTKSEWLQQSVKDNERNRQCVIWPFGCNHDGYGKLFHEGKLVSAHRLAYKLANGNWPEPCGRHTCDTPNCVNANHIIPGSHGDNIHDMLERNRHAIGENSGRSVLIEEEVRQIRNDYSWYNVTLQQLADRYAVDQRTIFDIVHRKTWKHVP